MNVNIYLDLEDGCGGCSMMIAPWLFVAKPEFRYALPGLDLLQHLDKTLMSQLTRGQKRRLMYVENKTGDIEGAKARIGWVEFSRSGRSIYYRERTLARLKGGGVSGNYFDVDGGDEYWVSGVKKNKQDAHCAKHVEVIVDEDAVASYNECVDAC